MLLKIVPPRWRCVCPGGKKRERVGPHAFVCKGGGGGGGFDPKKKCLQKGWHWTGALCIPKIGKCKNGYVGKWPNCKKIVEPPKKCPQGSFGKWPHCKKVGQPPKHCPNGTFGTPPNCKKIVHKPNDKLEELKKALKKFQLQKKKD